MMILLYVRLLQFETAERLRQSCCDRSSGDAVDEAAQSPRVVGMVDSA